MGKATRGTLPLQAPRDASPPQEKQSWPIVKAVQEGKQPSPRKDARNGRLATDKVPPGLSEKRDDGWPKRRRCSLLYLSRRHSR
eukprot:262389-Chlamydomonas_euryale.AAC.1